MLFRGNGLRSLTSCSSHMLLLGGKVAILADMMQRVAPISQYACPLRNTLYPNRGFYIGYNKQDACKIYMNNIFNRCKCQIYQNMSGAGQYSTQGVNNDYVYV